MTADINTLLRGGPYGVMIGAAWGVGQALSAKVITPSEALLVFGFLGVLAVAYGGMYDKRESTSKVIDRNSAALERQAESNFAVASALREFRGDIDRSAKQDAMLERFERATEKIEDSVAKAVAKK
jgi:hypothetical protein